MVSLLARHLRWPFHEWHHNRHNNVEPTVNNPWIGKSNRHYDFNLKCGWNVFLRRMHAPDTSWQLILLIIFHHILQKNLHMINRYWTTVETVAEIERDCKEWQLNSAWEIGNTVVWCRDYYPTIFQHRNVNGVCLLGYNVNSQPPRSGRSICWYNILVV